MDIPLMSMTEFLFQYFDKFSNIVALIDYETSRDITYRELKPLVIRVARGFKSLGFKTGDVVCVFATNIIEYPIILYALAAIGAIMQATNPLSTIAELKAQCEECKTKYIITLPNLLNTVKRSRTDTIQEIICIGCGDDCVPFEQVLTSGEGSDFEFPTFDPRKTVACLFFSSGTTGLPKAVQLTHSNIIANLIQYKSYGVTESDSMLVILPFYHLYGLIVTLTSSLMFGCKHILLPRFDLETYMMAVEKYQISVLQLVPPVLVKLAKLSKPLHYDLTCVHMVVCASAPLSSDIEQQAIEIFQIPYISQVYGVSECMGVTLNSKEQHKFGSVGHVVQGIEAKIINLETKEKLPPNQPGEVYIKGPQVMFGYLNKPEATAAMIDTEGWAATGDVGYFDEDGLLFIVDRIKEMIKYNGHQVAPAELEALLLTHPLVDDVAVIGIPDEAAGQLPKAFVVLRNGSQLTCTEIQEFVEDIEDT